MAEQTTDGDGTGKADGTGQSLFEWTGQWRWVIWLRWMGWPACLADSLVRVDDGLVYGRGRMAGRGSVPAGLPAGPASVVSGTASLGRRLLEESD